MITQAEYRSAVEGTLALFAKAHIAVTEEEAASIEVADFGLSNLREIGLQLLVYVNTPRVCAKEMALFPGQTCPEHMHPRSRASRARRRPSAAAMASATSSSATPRMRSARRASPPRARRTSPPAGRSSCGPASSTPSIPARCTGSPPGTRAPWSRSSPRQAGTRRTSSQTRPSSAPRSWRDRPPTRRKFCRNERIPEIYMAKQRKSVVK